MNQWLPSIKEPNYSLSVFLKTLQATHNLPIIYISHDLSTVMHFADEVIVLDNGRLLSQGSPKTVLPTITTSKAQNRTDIPNTFCGQIIAHSKQKDLPSSAQTASISRFQLSSAPQKASFFSPCMPPTLFFLFSAQRD